MSRVGIQGGTFDPPHMAHLILGEIAADWLNADHYLFVPAADPPHKRGQVKAAADHRVAMVQRAIADNPRFALSRVDVDRPGPHYSVDMLRLIGQQYPGAELYFVIGGDSFAALPTWYRPDELIRLCRLLVMHRPGDGVQADMHAAALPDLMGRVTVVDAPLLEVSSSAVVERVRAGQSIRYWVPDAVREYIHQEKLYR